MKLTFLGTGAAFSVREQNYHSNILLESPEKKRFLIDCGSDIRFSLTALGLDYRDLSDIYISHLHADHVGGLEWLGFNRIFADRLPRARLYLHHTLYQPLWENTLKGGMGTVSGEVPTLETFFDVTQIADNQLFHWEQVEFRAVQTVHVMHGCTLLPSYGLYFTVNHKNIFITTDTQFCPTLYQYFYKNADLIFHDCETKTMMSGVHAHYQQLTTLNSEIKAKTWLYHYNNNNLPDCKKDGFLGFVAKGQVFDL